MSLNLISKFSIKYRSLLIQKVYQKKKKKKENIEIPDFKHLSNQIIYL